MKDNEIQIFKRLIQTNTKRYSMKKIEINEKNNPASHIHYKIHFPTHSELRNKTASINI